MREEERRLIISILKRRGNSNPTEKEIMDGYLAYVERKRRQASNENALRLYRIKIAEGYLHTDGVTYNCDEEATNDIAKIMALVSIDPAEYVSVLSKNNSIVELTMPEFKALIIAIGHYHYKIKMLFWSKLQDED